MRLLIDMNLSPLWAAYLKTDGREAAHWSTLGLATAADGQLMRYATSQGV